MESFPIDSLPTAGDIHMACFTAVKNAPDLKEKLQNQDKSLTFAIVESNLVKRIPQSIFFPLYDRILLC